MKSTRYGECESYQHKAAKDVVKSWIHEMNPPGCDDAWIFKTNQHKENGKRLFLGGRNQGNVYLEFPIIEFADGFHSSDEPNWYSTREECIANKRYPKRVIDLVIPHKGYPHTFIEICHKNPVSDKKIKELKEIGVNNLIEIDANWILSQVKRPRILKIKRWLI